MTFFDIINYLFLAVNISFLLFNNKNLKNLTKETLEFTREVSKAIKMNRDTEEKLQRINEIKKEIADEKMKGIKKVTIYANKD